METIIDTVGRTPLVRLQRLAQPGDAEIGLKCERGNPGGSIKDRPARWIIEQAERGGWLAPGGTIIESSSGNFGISLAMMGAARGYRVLILVDPKTTPANLAMLRAYGAEVLVVTEQDDSGSYHKTRIALANQLAREIPGAFRPDQCFNLLNSEAHYEHTARELLRDCEGRLDAVVAAASTGGQLGGLARYFRRHAPRVRVIGVDAVGSAIFGGPAHSYLMPGVGLGWTPANLDLSLLHAAFNVPDEDAFLACRLLARSEGIMAGASGGAALIAGLRLARQLGAGARIVCVLADSGERYLQTIYNDEWMAERGMALSADAADLRRRALALAPAPLIKTCQPGLEQALAVPDSTATLSAQAGQRQREQERLASRPPRLTHMSTAHDMYC